MFGARYISKSREKIAELKQIMCYKFQVDGHK